MTSCSKKAEEPASENPFFSEYKTPFQVPPFDIIKPEHFIPAYEAGMSEHSKEIDIIVNNQEAPTFENTIAALDRSGRLLTRVSVYSAD